MFASLRHDRFGNALTDTTRHVLNLSDYVLSDTESFVLSHGLNFGLSPRHLCKEEIFAEFESLWAQLLHHSASSVEQCTALKARLADLAHLYCDSTIDSRDFTMRKECFGAINSLRKNDIIVTKPDKGSGVVLLNKSDYVDKMNKILDDQSRFKRLGPVSSNDNTAGIESRLQKRLLDLVKADLRPKWVCEAIRPTGSQRPRMYGLPKTHKEGIPLRPILSMKGSSHHELGKWLTGLLQPVLERFSSHCIPDSFTFAKTMQNLDIDPDVFMCSFDVSSLFTNVPLDETIKICSKSLYDQSDSQTLISKDVFVELMESATSSVEFSFNNTMHKHTDGVAMGLPFGPALVNIVVEYFMKKSYFPKRRSLQHTSDMLRTRLPSSITKLKQMNF